MCLGPRCLELLDELSRVGRLVTGLPPERDGEFSSARTAALGLQVLAGRCDRTVSRTELRSSGSGANALFVIAVAAGQRFLGGSVIVRVDCIAVKHPPSRAVAKVVDVVTGGRGRWRRL